MTLEANGHLMTVTGPITANEMGLTLVHEHLFNDLSSVVDSPFYDFSQVVVDRPVEPGIMWALRQDPYASADNMAEKPVDNIVKEVEAFANLGGRTIVDATGSDAIGRNPERLRRVAEVTGVNIVASTGPYIEKFEQHRITSRNIDTQAGDMVRDLREGIGDTDIKAGMLGEVGVSPAFTEGEHGALMAAALAQTEVPHVALNIHMPGWQRRGDEVLDIVLDRAGVSPQKVSLAHSDPSGTDVDYQRRLLDRGVWLEFDMIGLDITFPKEGVSPTVEETISAIVGLINDGYESQLVLSHDLFLKQMWTHNGGNGLTFVPYVFTALLQEQGVSTETCHRLMYENPQKLLT